jgi:hypothetical protein
VAGRVVIEQSAAQAGRSISAEHFGVSIGYARAPLDELTSRRLAARLGERAAELVPVGIPALRTLLKQFVGVGFSKFVVRPLSAPASWRQELEALADGVGDLQT